MNGYTIALFLHILGVVALFAGIALQQSGAARLRGATTVQEVRLWLGFLRPAAGLFPAAVVILLASGLYMMSRAWSLRTPFVAVGLITVVLMAAVGASVLRSRFEAIGRASAEAGEGPIPPQIDRLVASPVTWVVLSAINGAAVGVVWVMTNKPGWAAAPTIVAALAAVGGGVGAYLSGRRTGQRGGARPAEFDPTNMA